MIIRKAEEKDLYDIMDIYNYEIENGTATFDMKPKSYDEIYSWYEEHSKPNRIILTAENNGVAVGFVSLSVYYEKDAYIGTAELSVYVSENMRGQGIGHDLMKSIIKYAKENTDIHIIVSVITSDNTVSKKMHEKFGFKYSGTLHEVGYKFGKYHSVDNYELML